MSTFMNAANKYRRAHWLAKHHLAPLAKLYEMWIYLIHNSFIPASCEIGEGTSFGYKGIGVVVHSRARIGKNCLIAQNVTIGGRSGHEEKGAGGGAGRCGRAHGHEPHCKADRGSDGL